MAPQKTEGPMRLLIIIATAVVVVAIGYTVASMLSPQEVHISFKDLPLPDGH
jgi:hypothetical protein